MNNYQEPIRQYDNNLKVDEAYINTLPDLQNGPSSLIQGSPVKIQHVGIHNFRLPLSFRVKDQEEPIQLETSVTGTVSLEAEKKGINMSRILRSFYDFKDKEFTLDKVDNILSAYKNKLGSFSAKIVMKFSYPIIQKSLRSGLEGYQYYDVAFEVDINEKDEITNIIHFYFVYSSACPCSYELGQHALKHRNRAVVPHSQRSVARISVALKEHVWIEEIQELCIKALKTETQVMVKREDEQAFAELNGSNLKFVEDAVRLLYEQFNGDDRFSDFKIVCSHQESLHSHDAISVIVKGVPGGFNSDADVEVFKSLLR